MSKSVVKVLKYNAVFEPCEEGGFTVTVPKLPGLVTEGDTYELAIEMARDAIGGYLRVLQEDGEEIPEPDENSFVVPVNVTGPRFAVQCSVWEICPR
ncbi:MAG: type II toxin-antitoxin system HicB family antitoxin [Patescibacteria group bacterium]